MAIKGHKNGTRRAPESLSKAAKELWRSTLQHWHFETESDYCLLTSLCHCWDRMQAARVEIQKHGTLIPGKYGLKQNPAAAIERESSKEFRSILVEMGKQDSSKKRPKPGRPPGSGASIL